MAEESNATPQPGSYHEQNVQLLRALVLANALAGAIWLLNLQAHCVGLEVPQKCEELLKNSQEANLLHEAGNLVGLVGITAHSLAFGLLAVASLATIALRNVVPGRWKYRLVFTRWQHPLPGCRAFTCYAKGDDRIDMQQVDRWYPADNPATQHEAAEQNKRWYKILKKEERENSYLAYNHRIFLLLVDSMSVVLMMMAMLFPILLYVGTPGGAWPLLAIMGAELLVFWVGARNAGIALVRDVLAAASVTD